MAERLRRHASAMRLPNYIDMMERAARDLDAEARELEESRSPPPGRHLDITI